MTFLSLYTSEIGGAVRSPSSLGKSSSAICPTTLPNAWSVMMGQQMFAWVDKHLRYGTGRLDKPCGGLSVILIGDFGQLPPVSDTPLYTKQFALHGYTMYHLFSTVVIFDQVCRQSGSNPSSCAFRELLLCLRDGETTQHVWQILLQQAPQNVQNCHDFDDAIWLFYDKRSVASYNMQQILNLNTPVAQLSAIHPNNQSKWVSSDDAVFFSISC